MRRSPDRVHWPVLCVCVAMLAVVLPGPVAVATQPRITVAGSAPIPKSDKIVATPITTTFNVALRSRNPAAEAAYVANLSNTASPNFHHFLSTAQFAKRFGASSSSERAVRSYLLEYGLRVGALSKGRVLLHVKGLTSNIARAFAAKVATIRRPNGVLAAQFVSKGTLPNSLAHDVVGVAGLSSVVQPSTNIARAKVSARTTLPTACPSDGGETSNFPNSLGGYTVLQEAELYGINTAWANGDTGSGQTIAIYELSPFDPSDLATYLDCYSLDPTITSIPVDGGPSGSLDDEPTLDIEEATALAPGAVIDVYQGPNNSTGPTDVYAQIADDNEASIVSTSWGTCESDPNGDPAAEQPIFEQMAAQGQTVVSAAGDAGSSDCNGITNNSLAVDDPASQPFVTGVGGLSVNDINPLEESVWLTPTKNGDAGAGGGGVSSLWSRPTWQTAPGIAASETMRLVPDLSTLADPSTGFIQYFTGTNAGTCQNGCPQGWNSIGGTSIGAPLVSALVAVSAQACGTSRLGFINPSLYAMASTGFVDVTTGTNDLYNVGDYSAGVGFDEASGLGSPNGAAFIAGLCPPKFDLAKSSFAISSTSAWVNAAPVTVTATLRDTNGNAIANATVNVSATSVGTGSFGQVEIDSDLSSVTTNGGAAYTVTSDANGKASFTISTTEPSPVSVTVSYESQTIFHSTIEFTDSSKTASKVPGKPSIAKLTGIVGGFTLSVKAPSSNGGSAITAYQYSVSGGTRWFSLAKRSTSIRVSDLVRGKTYRVNVRALNVNGAGAASAAKGVVTRR
ncbi:MAG: protease pro-enzyme activation domain-containing protein [Acidimicrobiales bacterium]